MSTRGKLLRATLRRRKRRYHRLLDHVYSWTYDARKMRL